MGEAGFCSHRSRLLLLHLFCPVVPRKKDLLAETHTEITLTSPFLGFDSISLSRNDIVHGMKKMHALTRYTESRAATANISAHETTVFLQDLSTAALILSITSNPLIDPAFGTAVFSPVKVDVSSSRTEPSQPCNSQQYIYEHEHMHVIIT